MRSYIADFRGPTKTPKIIAEKMNEILQKGALKAVNVCESQAGRLFVKVLLDEKAEPNTKCAAFRHTQPEKLQEDVNKFLSGEVKLKASTLSVSSRSNNLMALLFFES